MRVRDQQHRLLLLSGIGKPYDPLTGEGTVGRNYTHQTTSTVSRFFDESMEINPFMSSGAAAVTMDDLRSDNFDHGPHGSIVGIQWPAMGEDYWVSAFPVLIKVPPGLARDSSRGFRCPRPQGPRIAVQAKPRNRQCCASSALRTAILVRSAVPPPEPHRV